jgi:uncharacterized membrane protein YbhN (UPF0104 family)
VASPGQPQEAPTFGNIKGKLIRGGIIVAVLAAVAVGIVSLVPGLSGVRSAIGGALPGWIIGAAGIQLIGIAGAVVFVQLVYADVPQRLTWKMGGAQQAADALLPTAGSTAVSYWTLSSIGWGVERFAERAAVMIIAPAAPNVLLVIILGLGMGLHLFAGPHDPLLTFLPAVVGIVVVAVALWAAGWGHRLAARTRHRWLREALHIAATGVTGTVEILRRRSWRVVGTWVDLLFAIGALWAALFAVGEHLPYTAVAMGFLIGQVLQVIPVPGGVGAIDVGVTGGLVLYGADPSAAAAGELIWHALALLVRLVAGSSAFVLLPREIERSQSNLALGSANPSHPAGSEV